MKGSHLFAGLLAGVLALGLSAGVAMAEKAEKKTISGKSACATCDGVTKAAHKVRKGGEKMTATLAGEPETKKDDKGKEYKEAKVSEIKIG